MSKGEKARLTITGDYAYGPSGYPGLVRCAARPPVSVPSYALRRDRPVCVPSDATAPFAWPRLPRLRGPSSRVPSYRGCATNTVCMHTHRPDPAERDPDLRGRAHRYPPLSWPSFASVSACARLLREVGEPHAPPGATTCVSVYCAARRPRGTSPLMFKPSCTKSHKRKKRMGRGRGCPKKHT